MPPRETWPSIGEYVSDSVSAYLRSLMRTMLQSFCVAVWLLWLPLLAYSEENPVQTPLIAATLLGKEIDLNKLVDSAQVKSSGRSSLRSSLRGGFSSTRLIACSTRSNFRSGKTGLLVRSRALQIRNSIS